MKNRAISAATYREGGKNRAAEDGEKRNERNGMRVWAKVKSEVSRCRSAIANRTTIGDEEGEELGVLETW